MSYIWEVDGAVVVTGSGRRMATQTDTATIVDAIKYGLANAPSKMRPADKVAFAAAFAKHSFPQFGVALDSICNAFSRVDTLRVNLAAEKLSPRALFALVGSGVLDGKFGEDADAALGAWLAG